MEGDSFQCEAEKAFVSRIHYKRGGGEERDRGNLTVHLDQGHFFTFWQTLQVWLYLELIQAGSALHQSSR